MRTNRIRTTALAATTLLAALSLTACNGLTDDASPASTGDASSVSAESSPNAKDTGTADATGGTGDKGTSTGGSSSGSTSKSSSTAKSSSGGSSSGDKSGYGQSCGTNDLNWSTRSETQAGGYILIMAKAKPGITCVLSGSLPVVAFGSDGTEASNAEQVVGDDLTLSGSTTAYAGVNPKTTNNNYGKELTSIIVSASNNDPNPISLKTGTITVDKPIVTNWHTSPSDAIPGDGGTDE
ncbi:DUF4232 domain-containing protein [Streptomyces sp. NPDC019531]|uniref:DUF4232 domain-containing protein n=1 Tax=Streptomyces sp. NPDC019531 TaxID=3365062 RepID=UPI00384F461E